MCRLVSGFNALAARVCDPYMCVRGQSGDPEVHRAERLSLTCALLRFVVVYLLQARQHAQSRQQMAADSKSDYSSYLQKFNQDQSEHYFTIIPNIFQVNVTAP